jgi:exodeoxyribonuclease V beta subunit
MLADLHSLAAASGNSIAVVPLTRSEPSPPSLQPDASAPALQVQPILRRGFPPWRTSSFSALIAPSSTTLSSPEEEGIDHDAAPNVADEVGSAVALGVPSEAVKLSFAELRGGARAGNFVHRVLEKLDFVHGSMAELCARLDDIVPRTPVERASFDSLADGIADVLDVPLGGAAGSLKLRQLSLRQRLNELEFILPVAGGNSPRLTVSKLAAVFARHAATPAQSRYAQRLEHLGFAVLEGYLRGFIDLVFEHDGRWYIVDYKTNFLGAAPIDYIGSALETPMALHHYPLQYHLYTVALHRHLSARLAGYDYDRHFGGVYYLFLRGMSARFPAGNGIWYDRPPRAMVDDLSALFSEPVTQPGSSR